MKISVEPQKPGEIKVRRERRPQNKSRYEKIAALAFRFYEEEGRPEGRHLEHWLKAEGMVEHEGALDRV